MRSKFLQQLKKDTCEDGRLGGGGVGRNLRTWGEVGVGIVSGTLYVLNSILNNFANHSEYFN